MLIRVYMSDHRVSTRINILDQANNFDGTNKIMSGDCPATMTLQDCEAKYWKELKDYKDASKPPRLHPAGVALYRSDSFVSDVAAPCQGCGELCVMGDIGGDMV